MAVNQGEKIANPLHEDEDVVSGHAESDSLEAVQTADNKDESEHQKAEKYAKSEAEATKLRHRQKFPQHVDHKDDNGNANFKGDLKLHEDYAEVYFRAENSDHFGYAVRKALIRPDGGNLLHCRPVHLREECEQTAGIAFRVGDHAELKLPMTIFSAAAVAPLTVATDRNSAAEHFLELLYFVPVWLGVAFSVVSQFVFIKHLNVSVEDKTDESCTTGADGEVILRAFAVLVFCGSIMNDLSQTAAIIQYIEQIPGYDSKSARIASALGFRALAETVNVRRPHDKDVTANDETPDLPTQNFDDDASALSPTTGLAELLKAPLDSVGLDPKSLQEAQERQQFHPAEKGGMFKLKRWLPGTGLSTAEKLVAYVFCALPKLATEIMLLVVGVGFVAHGEGAQDVIAKTLEVHFILEIDDIIYHLMTSDAIKDLLTSDLPPLPVALNNKQYQMWDREQEKWKFVKDLSSQDGQSCLPLRKIYRQWEHLVLKIKGWIVLSAMVVFATVLWDMWCPVSPGMLTLVINDLTGKGFSATDSDGSEPGS